MWINDPDRFDFFCSSIKALCFGGGTGSIWNPIHRFSRRMAASRIRKTIDWEWIVYNLFCRLYLNESFKRSPQSIQFICLQIGNLLFFTFVHTVLPWRFLQIPPKAFKQAPKLFRVTLSSPGAVSPQWARMRSNPLHVLFSLIWINVSQEIIQHRCLVQLLLVPLRNTTKTPQIHDHFIFQIRTDYGILTDWFFWRQTISTKCAAVLPVPPTITDFLCSVSWHRIWAIVFT